MENATASELQIPAQSSKDVLSHLIRMGFNHVLRVDSTSRGAGYETLGLVGLVGARARPSIDRASKARAWCPTAKRTDSLGRQGQRVSLC